MPSVKLSKKVVEKLVGKKLCDEVLADRISMLGTDLEYIKGDEINVEVFPNRPDLLSEAGLARALATFVEAKLGLSKFEIKNSNQKVIVDKSVELVRPFTACAIVKNLKITDEIIRDLMQMQEKLHVTYGRHRKKLAIGVYPLEKINFPITYCAKPIKEIKFQPLGAKQEMSATQILTETPMGKEYSQLLEGLKSYPLFLDANGEVLSMPPIINSHNIGKVELTTKNVFVEVSGFDFDTCSTCLNIITSALSDMGGYLESVEVIYDSGVKVTPILTPSKMPFDIAYANKRLGLELDEKQATKLLQKMGMDYDKGNAIIPAYRADIMHPIDIVEDIAIAYGYENFKEVIPDVSTIAAQDPFEIFKNRIIKILVGAGLLEVSSYHLTNENDHCTKMNNGLKPIPLANALTKDYNSLRSWMIPNMLKILSENKHHEYPQEIFEVGRIFKEGKSETGIVEDQRLVIAICSPTSDFTQIKQFLDLLFGAMDKEYSASAVDHSSFIPGRVARISYEAENIAYLGEIHPQVLENWNIIMPTSVLELNLTQLWRQIK